MRPERTDALLPGHGDSASASTSTTHGDRQEADTADGNRCNGHKGTTRPEFIRVLPAEVESYGPQGAILLAHIRFRCDSDGPGRITADGLRWWRVPLPQLVHETGLSLAGVRTGFKALGDAVAARHFKPLSDRSWAYRVATRQNGADLPSVEIDTWADQPSVEIDRSSVEIDTSIGRNRQIHMSKSTDVLLTQEAKKWEKPSGRVCWYLRPFPETPPSKFCADHPNGAAKSCGPCGASRQAYTAWVEDAWLWLNEAERVRDNTKDDEQAQTVGRKRSRLLAALGALKEKRPA